MKSIIVILKNPNFHLISIYEELRKQQKYNISYYCWEDLPEYRKNNNWELPENLKVGFDPKNELKKLIAADILVFHGIIAPFPKNLLLFRKMLKKRKSIFMSSEGFERSHTKGIRKKIFQWLVNSPKVTYLAIGKNAHSDYRSMGMTKWKMRKFAFSEPYLPAPENAHADTKEINIIVPGRLVEIKNLPSLFEALSEYKGDKEVKLHLAGEGELKEELKALAHKLDIADKVIFTGQLHQQELHELFLAAHFLVLPSHYDGWGVVINQALHYGLPVLISKNVRSGQDFLVDHNKNGYIFNDQSEFNNYLKRLIEENDTRRSFGKVAREKYDLWRIENIAKRLSEVFENPAIDFEEGPLKIIP